MGNLFLIGTPIGNLEDMSYRAVRILREADEVYCEDTRRTQILINHYKIELKKPLKSYHEHSNRTVVSQIKEALLAGKSVAYCSDAGMPVVSDPGFLLVREAVKNDVKVEVISGPSAAVMLFAMSALETPKYLFHGFFPQTKGEISRVLEQINTLHVAHIFYEGPSRVTKTLEMIAKHFPKRKVVFGRELTKVHEEVVRGELKETVDELIARDKIRGECVFAVLGGVDESELPKPEVKTIVHAESGEEIEVIELTDDQKKEIAKVVSTGVTSKDAAKDLSKKFGVPRRVIYEYIVKKLT